MARFFSHPRFLAAYSAVLTIVFVVTTAMNLKLVRVSGAEKKDTHPVEFDQITVHRMNVVEPDGTTRLVISDKAEFPGGFFKGKEFTRADRSSAGMLFMNDEGTENGGMVFGGERTPDGKLHSYGHLSFDEYEQDQTMSLTTFQDGDERGTAYEINDNATDTLETPEVTELFASIHAMPDGPEKEKARAAFRARYPIGLPARARLERGPDKSSQLRLCDPEGHTRILLRVAANGTPTMQFLDAEGKVTHQWPEDPAQSQPKKQ